MLRCFGRRGCYSLPLRRDSNVPPNQPCSPPPHPCRVGDEVLWLLLQARLVHVLHVRESDSLPGERIYSQSQQGSLSPWQRSVATSYIQRDSLIGTLRTNGVLKVLAPMLPFFQNVYFFFIKEDKKKKKRKLAPATTQPCINVNHCR